MPVIIQCASCNTTLRVPENLLGQMVKCHSCGTTFRAPESQPAAPGAPEPFSQPGVFQPPPPSPMYPRDRYDDREEPKSLGGMVLAPAICLIVTAALGIILDAVGLIMAMGPPPRADPNLPPWLNDFQKSGHGPLSAFISILFLAVSAVILTGAIQMVRQKSWGLALAGSILAMVNISGCCCILGLPFGIWALVILVRPDVKSAFS